MSETARTPKRAPSVEAMLALREAASALEVEEILDLCYAFARERVRLVVYLDALRQKGSRKAQAAACLICFDLARQGDLRAEQEFLALVPVMRAYAAPTDGDRGPMDALVEGSTYLVALWQDLERRLAAMDPRVDDSGAHALAPRDAEAIEIDLFSDEDIVDLDLDDFDQLSADAEALLAGWNASVERFFSWDNVGSQVASGRARLLSRPGLSAKNKDDLARVEAFRDDAVSFASHVDDARAILPVVELFLASQTRAKNLFGRRNPARDAVLEAGLARFTALKEPPCEAFAWLQPPTGGTHAWDKVAEILLDYVAFLGRALPPEDAAAEEIARAYVAADRPQPPPAVLAEDGARRRR